MDACTGCGEPLEADAEWCLQCLTPVGVGAAPVAAGATAAANGSSAAPPVATVAPPEPPAPPAWSPPAWSPPAPAPAWSPPAPAPAWSPPAPAPAPASDASAGLPSWAQPAAPAGGDPWARANSEPWSTTNGSVTDESAPRIGSWVPPREGLAPNSAVGGTVAGILGAGLLLQIVMSALGGGDGEVADAVNRASWWIAGYYAVVLWWVVAKSKAVGFEPRWSRGGPRYEGIVFGLVSGVVTCSAVLLFFRSRYDTTLIEDNMRVQLGDLTFVSIALTVLISVIAAPVVEELLFRGLLMEALRHRSVKAAFLVSAFLFAIWHWQLHPFQILYYTIMGLLLAAVFWKWGLVSSMACHFAFNGTLLLLTLVFLLGPGTTISADGATFDVPGGWDKTHPREVAWLTESFPDLKVAAKGPGGAVVFLEHATAPVPGDWNADFLLMVLNEMLVDTDEIDVRHETMRPVEYPAGRAAYLEMEIQGRESWAVVFTRGQDLWSFTFVTAGSNRAKDDFEDMLHKLYIP